MTNDELFFNEDVNTDLLTDEWLMKHSLVNDFGEWKVVDNTEGEKDVG